MTQNPAAEPLVNLSEIAEIELFILKRMKEFTLGDHASLFKGSGFNFVGLRDWQPGDRVSSVDWAQSSLNNFSPLITREFEQDSNATIVAVADASMSTRCGVNGVPIAAAIARSVAAVGLSAVFFQDQFGLITFDDRFRQMAAARPRIGKPHVMYCLDLYQQFKTSDAGAPGDSIQDVTAAIEGHLRKTSMVPVISDFLLPDVERVIKELSLISGMHDVFLMMADVRFAYQLPSASDSIGGKWRRRSSNSPASGGCGSSSKHMKRLLALVVLAVATTAAAQAPKPPAPKPQPP